MGKVARPRRRKRAKPVCRPKRKRAHKRASGDERFLLIGKRRKPTRCKPKKRRRRPVVPVVPLVPAPVPPPPIPAPPYELESPISVYSGPWGPAQAERLLWRAAFGPGPGWVGTYTAAGLKGAVQSLTRPQGAVLLTGAEPVIGDPPEPIEPEDAFGHDHQWFLDRMVRTSQPLIERMTLIWHDWFATSESGVGDQGMMLDQNELFRSNPFGSFRDLLRQVTCDPAMLVWLDGIRNRKGEINENYAREVMELFTLGADRGAYTETDVRELAKALSGWRADVMNGTFVNFRFDATRFQSTTKTLFPDISGYGPKVGNFNWEDAARLCVEHPLHPSFAVTKLWSYFIPTPPPAGERQLLEVHYVNTGYQIRPVVEAILMHPDLYNGPRMVKPPAVLSAGMLRALGRPVDREWWSLTRDAGQFLFRPPDVSGWDDSRWLDTQTVRARWNLALAALAAHVLKGPDAAAYDPEETPEQAVRAALGFWSDPTLTAETRASLTSFAASCLPAVMTSPQKSIYRAYRQNALRHLLVASPDYQTA